MARPEAASSEEPKAPGTPSRPWREASDRLRATGRTFVVMLGSVAATVAAGIGLAQLGGLQPGTSRFEIAIIGLSLVAVGIIALLTLAVGLASASTVSISELQTKRYSYGHARSIVNRPENGLLAGFKTLEQLVSATNHSLEEEAESVAAYRKEPTAENLQRQQIKRVVADWYSGRLRRVAEAAGYLRLRYRFERAAWGMVIAAAFAAFGIVAYAWAVTGVPGEVVVVASNEQVTVAAPDDEAGRDLFHRLLGCDADAVEGLTLPGDEPQVITLPDRATGCVSIIVPIHVSQDGRIAADLDNLQMGVGSSKE